MNWDDTAIACLRRLWSQGLSSQQIAARMGTTKNAVVGKAHRLNLPSRPSPIKAGGPRRAPAPMRKPKVTLPVLRVETVPGIEPVTPLRAVDVRFPPAAAAPASPPPPPVSSRRCCWPDWPDGAKPTHVYCDAPIPGDPDGPVRPYCDVHQAKSRAGYVAPYLRDKAVGLPGNSARRLVGAA